VGTFLHSSGKLAFNEKADIDIRGMLDDYKDSWDDKSLDLDDIAPDIDSTEEDSESSYGKGYMGATGLLFATAGLQSVSGMLDKAWDDNDYDDLGAVILEAVDADDVKPYMGPGSHAYNTSIQSTSNGSGTAGTPVTQPYTLRRATAA
jgi:hypothetical protein